ncbi:chemotaxis protein CheW [Azomonas macrocytogenes]|uniref:Twitching motility protein PilI n=1 Tax=Azomonas macrocytogenes TaxID=69962 RepID=A0A839T522_AZOMA|nr:chemotaxis protein CheW [Azomonas macrocytogenes]MBB3103870.1 twitching motility protein PilI [Azomonas macrocytogenes]
MTDTDPVTGDSPTPFQRLKGIDSRCRALAAGLPLRQNATHTWGGIGFRMGERFYVAPLEEIGEILREPRYTPLPGVKSWVRGVANVRGRLLPVIDLCRYFGFELSSAYRQRRTMVLESGGVFAGLIVDEVLGMQHFPVEAFSEHPPAVEASIQPFLHGAFRREQFWLVFSPYALARHQDFLNVGL